jgi:hypothetical protein
MRHKGNRRDFSSAVAKRETSSITVDTQHAVQNTRCGDVLSKKALV